MEYRAERMNDGGVGWCLEREEPGERGRGALLVCLKIDSLSGPRN